MKKSKRNSGSIVNTKALHDYTVLETVEAGVVLTGAEVKSVRLGMASLKESFVTLTKSGAQLLNAQITPYKFARNEEYEPKQTRALLLHKSEIEKLRGKVQQKGVSLVPLKIYSKRGKFKVAVGVVRGKKEFEKREMLKRRDIAREVERELKERGKS